jgi:hypothetical protein
MFWPKAREAEDPVTPPYTYGSSDACETDFEIGDDQKIVREAGKTLPPKYGGMLGCGSVKR